MFRIHFAATRGLRALLCIAILCVISSAGCGAGDVLPPPGDGSVDPDILPSEIEEPIEDGTPDDGAGSDEPVVVEPPDPSGQNEPPSVDAGADQTLLESERVTLDGTASSDPDGDELTFEWTVAGEVTVSLEDEHAAVTSFTAPDVDADTVIVFTLRVSDGKTEAEDTVQVLVRAQVEAALAGPEANAGPDQSVEAGVLVTLSGTASTSGEGGELTFDWFQTAGAPVALSSTSASVTTFTAPSEAAASQLIFELTVFEGGLADVDKVTVNVAAVAAPPPPPPPPDPTDNCPNDSNKTQPGVCGCAVADTDSDGDGTPNCVDGCPTNAAKIATGICGCSVADTDSDNDRAPNCMDGCPSDASKTLPGKCGCGVADTDTDGDTVANCIDGCPLDPGTSDPADCASTVGGGAQTDWDLVMLRLVNRARRDPAGEAARLGSSVNDSRAPVSPLAYDRATGQAATHHNTWMHLNLGSIASGRAPDSFTHYETVDGSSTGAPATSTPGYTGATLGTRMTAAGMNWGSVGENILTAYSGNTIAVDEAKMITNHRGWWDSSGHRNNMLSTSYTSFGHKVESQLFTPPRGGLNAPVDNILFATQNFARPLSNPRNCVFGVLYEDADGNNAWTPRQVGDASREGLAGVAFTVRVAGTATVVASDTTMDNGAFSARVADGTYDVRFTGSSLSGGVMTITGVVVSAANVDAGDWDAGP